MSHWLIAACTITYCQLASGDAAKPANMAPDIAWRNERLTLRANRMDLETVIGSISRTTGIPIRAGETLPVLEATVDLVEVPLVSALRQTFACCDLLLLYRSGTGQDGIPDRVLIYPRGRGEESLRTTLRQQDRAQALAKDKDHPDPARRARYVDKILAKVSGDEARAVVESALSDTDASVRERALAAAVSRNVAVSESDLARIATSDPSGALRLMALSALLQYVSQPEALRSVAEGARNDPDALVQAKAEEILQQLLQPVAADPATETATAVDAAPADEAIPP